MIGFIGAGLTLVPSIWMDVRKKEVPVLLLVISGLAGGLFRLFIIKDAWWSVLLGIGLGLVLFLIALLTKGSIGMGDGVLTAMIGAWLGLSLAASAVMFGFFFAAIAGLIAVLRKKGRKYRLPFAPFLGLGTLLTGVLEVLSGGFTWA